MNNCEMLSRKEAINILTRKPYLFGRAVGFNLLTDLHNNWIKTMVYDSDDQTLQAHRG